MNIEEKVSFIRTFNPFLLTCFFIVILCSSGYGKDKVNLGLIGRWGYRGAIKCVKIIKKNINENHFRYAYCGTNKGLLIIDATDENNLKEVAFLEIGNVNDIESFISGNYVILAGGINELCIFDISTPTRPVYVGSYRHGSIGYAQSITINDSYAYVAAGSNGLLILDISDPNGPVYIGGLGTQGHAIDVVISGDYAYVADGDNGLVIINISEPNKPKT
jgi:hypothetical protein